MQKFYNVEDLEENHQHCFKGKFSVTIKEQELFK